MTAVVLFSAQGTATAAQSAENAERLYGAVLGKWVYPDESRLTEFGFGADLLLGYPLSRSLNLELNGFTYGMERTDGEHDFHHGLGLDLMYEIGGYSFRPILLFGGGGSLEDVNGDQSFAPFANAGLGFIWDFPSEYLSFRFDTRYVGVFNDETDPNEDFYGDVHFNVGLQFLWAAFEQRDSEVVVVPVAAPADTDGDGVSDDLDQCPGTAPGVPVASNGCPLDDDKDGVINGQDACPNTPAGVPVGANGCPADSDRDGVGDLNDQCPGTPEGFRVDATGCVIQQTVSLNSVGFELGSDKLTSNAERILRDVARALNGQPGLNVEVGGHTDATGDAGYNQKLSERRAQSVVRYLVSQGVAADRLKSKGYGEFYPVASNDSESGRERNRRVEFKLLNR